MLSAFISSALRYPAVPLVRQQVHNRCVHPGPLVLGTKPLKYPTPTMDRDRTVSRRSEPSSRATLIGEHVNSWGRSACYPRGNFYPLSDGNSILYRLITKPCFRTCSTCRSHSQAPLCLYTRRMISNHSEGTFGRLRYFLGGDRPSQTAHLTLSQTRLTASG